MGPDDRVLGQPRMQWSTVIGRLDFEDSRSSADHWQALGIARVVAQVDELARLRRQHQVEKSQPEQQGADGQRVDRHQFAGHGIGRANRHATDFHVQFTEGPRLAEEHVAAGAAAVMPGGAPPENSAG
jgi:hypothetical protein